MCKVQVSVPWSIYTYLHSGYISGLVIWQPCKYNWDCATLMGLLSEGVDMVTLNFCAAGGSICPCNLGGEWFGLVTFWGWNPEWQSHLNYRC